MSKKKRKTKEIKNRQLMREVKKERLEMHLKHVEELIGIWIPQLSATDPFASCNRGESWGWQSVYEPDSEQDPDSNHMLRKHLRSRALWKHHSDWQWRLGRVLEMSAVVRTKATQVHHEGCAAVGLSSEKRAYTESYLATALWRAFSLARSPGPNLDYVPGDNGRGVRFGGCLIETTSGSKTEFETACEEHRSLSLELSETDEMRTLADEWVSVDELRNEMQLLAKKALKSSDFLYPCRFCKHLWRG